MPRLLIASRGQSPPGPDLAVSAPTRTRAARRSGAERVMTGRSNPGCTIAARTKMILWRPGLQEQAAERAPAPSGGRWSPPAPIGPRDPGPPTGHHCCPKSGVADKAGDHTLHSEFLCKEGACFRTEYRPVMIESRPQRVDSLPSSATVPLKKLKAYHFSGEMHQKPLQNEQVARWKPRAGEKDE